MPNIILTKIKGQNHEKPVKAKIHDFLDKLTENDETLGLHIEPMKQAADSRARTGRVDQGLRAVLYRLEDVGGEATYVYAGTFEHDTAIERARTRILKINPVNGVPELITASAPLVLATEATPEPATSAEPVAGPPYLESQGYLLTDLTEQLGFDSVTATKLWKAADADALLALSEEVDSGWQSHAVIALAAVDAIHKIKQDLGLEAPVTHETVGQPSSDSDLIDAFKNNLAGQMTFSYVGDDQDELRRTIDADDFGAWRVFLHPEQRRYATTDYNGPFRLTGGAGTGKTVVLLHRARHLADRDPKAAIVLTTFTRTLASNLQRDLQRLSPDVTIAPAVGSSGVAVRGIDQLAVAVRDAAGADFGHAAAMVLGVQIDSGKTLSRNDDGWSDAIDDVEPQLPDALLTSSFFEGEYLQVILPQRIIDRDAYFTARRPGRGVALDRSKRAQVWSVVERYRKTARMKGSISWAELSSIGAAWLENGGQNSAVRVDHLLVDEGQDLTASHWQLIRALARVGANDLFIADDSHQRIYGQHVVLSRFGIKIVGRSRRLTLNYRTTEQNLRFAMNVLAGVDYVNAGGEHEIATGYRSARRGPEPIAIAGDSESHQLVAIGDLIEGWIGEGVAAETIAVLGQSNNVAQRVVEALGQRGIAVGLVQKDTPPANKVVAMTMHTAKGMEFSRVVLFDISRDTYPAPWTLAKVAPEEAADVLLRARSLLYVAASRARASLVGTWTGAPSDLLGHKD